MTQEAQKLTAVEWLINWSKGNPVAFQSDYYEAIQQAKEMEKEQIEKYAEFCVRCDREGLKLIHFNDYIKL